MLRYLTVSLTSGLLFGLLDGLINANPLAVNLYSVYAPIMRTSINAPAGIMIDLVYGFILAWLFIMLKNSLPGKSGLMKGLNYGLLIWFFRVVMWSASSWIMFTIPTGTLVYGLVVGLGEMVVIGLLYGLVIKN
ncbi:MAG: hypothetical protein WC645_04040 [Candidatus Margulisiibacteriota bacterium]